MPPLNDKDLQALRRQLEQREALLQQEVRELRAEQAETPNAIARSEAEDAGEQGELLIRGQVRYAEQERDVQELRDIDAARERMAHGTYGVCMDCGTEIPFARLQALPTATRCQRCQEAFERRHGAQPRVARNL